MLFIHLSTKGKTTLTNTSSNKNPLLHKPVGSGLI